MLVSSKSETKSSQVCVVDAVCRNRYVVYDAGLNIKQFVMR